MLATAATGSMQPTTDAGLLYNASTNALTTTTFIGALQGNADTATTATTATNVTNISLANEATDTTCFPVFVTAATGNLPPKSNAGLTYNSNTSNLSSTILTATSNLVTDSIQTSGSSGVVMKNSGGTTVATLGSANTTNVTFAGAVNMSSIGTLTTPLSLANGGTGANYGSNALLFAGIKQAASDTSTGVVELATDAELQTGTDTSRAVTCANIKNSLGFSDYFQSSQQTITAAGSLTIAHGLGRTPILIYPVLQCTTADNNYSIGNELPIPFMDTSGSAGGLGISCVPDATNLNIRYGSGSGGNVFVALDKTSGATVSLTNGSWRLVLRAWA